MFRLDWWKKVHAAVWYSVLLFTKQSTGSFLAPRRALVASASAGEATISGKILLSSTGSITAVVSSQHNCYHQTNLAALSLSLSSSPSPNDTDESPTTMMARHAPIDTIITSSSSSSSEENHSMMQSTPPKKPFQVQTRNPFRLLVLRLGFTEPAMVSSLNYGKYQDGTFPCAYCGNVLFQGNAKYDSRTGWPSFWRSSSETSISYKSEWDGRMECRCQRCNSHLGHVFLDGPRSNQVPADLLQTIPETDPHRRSGNDYLPRFCINGAALRYQKAQFSSDDTNGAT